MTLNAYIRNAEATLSRSVRVDLQTSSAQMGVAEVSAEDLRRSEVVLDNQIKEQNVKIAGIQDRDFLDDVMNFFGDDGGEADAKRDLGLMQADLNAATNNQSLVKQDIKDATGRLADAVQLGSQTIQKIIDAADDRKEQRKAEEGQS